jgi:hypothetical protein
MNLAKLEISLFAFFGDQIQVALHLFNYNHIDYKIFASCAKFEKFHANSTFGGFPSRDSILGAFMCFNYDNQSLILMATSLKTKLRRCNLTSFFFIKGTRPKVVFSRLILVCDQFVASGKV